MSIDRDAWDGCQGRPEHLLGPSQQASLSQGAECQPHAYLPQLVQSKRLGLEAGKSANRTQLFALAPNTRIPAHPMNLIDEGRFGQARLSAQRTTKPRNASPKGVAAMALFLRSFTKLGELIPKDASGYLQRMKPPWDFATYT